MIVNCVLWSHQLRNYIELHNYAFYTFYAFTSNKSLLVTEGMRVVIEPRVRGETHLKVVGTFSKPRTWSSSGKALSSEPVLIRAKLTFTPLSPLKSNLPPVCACVKSASSACMGVKAQFESSFSSEDLRKCGLGARA